MNLPVLIRGLQQQFSEAFDVLEAAVRSFTPEQWATGQSPYEGPARCTIHALQCAEFYTDHDKSVFHRLGIPVWEMQNDQLPPQEEVLGYLQTVRKSAARWVDDLGHSGLDQPVEDTTCCALESIAYALRHLQHHTGELCVYQKQLGHPQEQWT